MKSTTIQVPDGVLSVGGRRALRAAGGAVVAVLVLMSACDDTSGPAPGLGVGPDSIAFSFVHRRDTAAVRQLTITNTGGGTLHWTAEAELEWLTVTPRTGSAPATVDLRVDTAGLIVGSYAGVVKIVADSGEEDSVFVALDVDGAPPSGITFVRGDTLYFMDSDGGQLRPLLADTARRSVIDWAPDGERFAVSRGPSRLVGALFDMRPDGSDIRLIADHGAGTPVYSPDWSPDGTRIVYTVYTEEPISRTDLWIVDVAAGDRQQFSTTADRATWSPDGSWIAFQSDLRIQLKRADGSAEVELAPDINHASAPSWSPDGTRIAFHVRDSAEGNITDWDLYIVEVESGETAVLTGSPEWDDLFPQWSPDGSRILFRRRGAEAGAVPRIFTIVPDGTGLTEIPGTEGAGAAQWRPWVAPGARR